EPDFPRGGTAALRGEPPGARARAERLTSRPQTSDARAPMPRNVVFVAPFPTDPTLRFLRAVSKLDDVRLLGVVHTPPSGDDARLFHDLVRVTSPLDAQDTIDGIE